MFERANSIIAIQQGRGQIGVNAMSLAALPNQSLHSDATAFRHLLLRALWISQPHPKSTLAVPPVSSNVRRLIEGFTSIRRVWGSRILSATHLDRAPQSWRRVSPDVEKLIAIEW